MANHRIFSVSVAVSFGALFVVSSLTLGPAAKAQHPVMIHPPVVMRAPNAQARPMVPIVRTAPVARFVSPIPGHTAVRTAPSTMHSVNRMHSHHETHSFSDRRNLANSNFGCAGFPGAQIIDPVPSFGFSFEHMQAVQGDLGIKAAIDPATQIRLGEASRFGCGAAIGTGGYFLLGGGYGIPEEAVDQSEPETTPSAQPQVIVVQQPAATQTSERPAPAVAQEAEPLPGPGQFILVMRDGSQVKALAFTHSGDMLVYITPEGNRRTVSVASVDPDATIRANSDRGTSLQLSL